MKSEQLKTVAILGLLAALTICFYGWVFGDNRVKSTSQQISAGSEQTYHWRLVTTWPKNFPGLGVGVENFAHMVQQMSNGRLSIEVFGGGEIVPALQVFDAVSEGSVQMGHGASYYWKGKTAASVFFTSVPFGMTIQEQNGWLFYGGGLELWRKVYEPFGLIPFAGGSTGVQMGGWFNKELKSLADIQGLKMRIPGLAGEVFTGAGGNSINVSGGELFTAMQTHVIDAAEWVGPYNDMAFGFHTVADYYYYPGWHEPGAALEFIVNADAWAELPDDLKAIVDAATKAIHGDMLADYAASNARSYQRLLEEGQVQVRPFPDDVIEKFKAVAADVMKNKAAKDPLFAEVYQSYSAFQKQIEPYTRISEQATVDMRED